MSLQKCLAVFLLVTTAFAANGQQKEIQRFSQTHAADLIYRGGSVENSRCPLVVRAKPLGDLLVIDPESVGNSCAAPASSTPPVIAPFGDDTFFVLASSIQYKLGPKRDDVIVPRGFITDLASTPRALWSLLPRDGQYESAAILHDYMYWDQRCTKDEADTILKLQMAEFGVPANVANDVYQGVHLFGSGAWEMNKKSRLRSIRVIPASYLDSFLKSELDAKRTWAELERQMMSSGVQPALDKQNPLIADICKRVAGF